MKRTRFYVCPRCGSFMQRLGEARPVCCTKELDALKANKVCDNHNITVEKIEDDFYVTFDHEMTKEHYISFLAYLSLDKILIVKLYPEQNPSVRFLQMHGGKFYYYCNRHGLFEYKG